MGKLDPQSPPFDPIPGSSPHPGLIKRANAAHLRENSPRNRRQHNEQGAELNKHRQTSHLAGETGGARRKSVGAEQVVCDSASSSMGSRIAAANQDCSISTSLVRLQRRLHDYDRVFSLRHLFSTIYLSSTVDAKEKSMRASPTNCSFQSRTQERTKERTELTCTSRFSSYTMPHPTSHYTCISQTRILDTLRISPSSTYLNCFYLSISNFPRVCVCVCV